jgi:hypothetical protein
MTMWARSQVFQSSPEDRPMKEIMRLMGVPAIKGQTAE